MGVIEFDGRLARVLQYRRCYQPKTVMLTVKMDAELERELETAARSAGLTKSEFVRRGLHDAIARAKKRGRPTPWELGHDLFGKVSSGKSDLSRTRTRDLMAARRNAKAAR